VLAKPAITAAEREVAVAQLYVAAGAPIKNEIEIDTAHLSEEATLIRKLATETDIRLTWPEVRILHLFAADQAKRNKD
jgi:hypothetical protein